MEPAGWTYEFGYALGDVTYLALGPIRERQEIKPGFVAFANAPGNFNPLS